MEITEIYSHRKKIRQITYLVISLVKILLSRNFCQKRVRVNFRNFHTVKWVLMTNQCSNTETFRDIIFEIDFTKYFLNISIFLGLFFFHIALLSYFYIHSIRTFKEFTSIFYTSRIGIFVRVVSGLLE